MSQEFTNLKQLDKEEQNLELLLRPKKLAEYIGQTKVKESMEIFIQAAKQRGEPLEHVLIYGSPGLGKTTLAHVLANEIGTNIRVSSGPAIERAGDLASILSNLSDGDILFIDEIHRLNKMVEEILYPAMEEYALDLILGKGPSAKTLRLDLPHFTLIGATTRLSLMTSPLRSRFGIIHHLDFYERGELEKIIERSAKILKLKIKKEGVEEIAKRARFTPRIANRLLKRIRDYSQVRGDGTIDQQTAKAALEILEIDEFGLDRVDRKLLTAIAQKFSGGPVGLETIAAVTHEEVETISEVYEPYLLQIGFLARTPKGRVLTPNAYQLLGLDKSEVKLL